MAATSATEIPKSPYSVLFSIPGTKAFCASAVSYTHLTLPTTLEV